MHRLYSFHLSGNCHKVRLLCQQLQIDYQLIELSIPKREHQSQAILELNPAGTLPILQLNGGPCLAESNAILWYLGRNSKLCPTDAYQQAQVISWFNFDQARIQPYIALRRRILVLLKQAEQQKERLNALYEPGIETLGLLNKALASRDFLVGQTYSLADICVFPYINLAEQANFDLTDFPKLSAWRERIKQQPGYLDL